MEMFCVLTESLSLSRLWYCTIVLEDATIEENWIKVNIDLSVYYFLQVHVNPHLFQNLKTYFFKYEDNMGWRPELFNFHPWTLAKSLHLPGLQFSYLWGRMTKLAQSSPDFDVKYKYRKQKQDEGSMHPVIINITSLAYLTELF